MAHVFSAAHKDGNWTRFDLLSLDVFMVLETRLNK